MTRRWTLGASALVAAIFTVAAAADGAGTSAEEQAHVASMGSGSAPHTPANWAFFEQFCVECHNATDWAGGVAFDTLTPEDVGTEAETFEEAVRKLRGRLMPPPNKPQPDQHAVDSMVAWLESRLDHAAAAHPHPGSVALHRLNRSEYARAVEDLLGLKVDAAALLPKDTKADGFDNVASVLKVSPSFLDQYIVAAHEVSLQAVGTPSPSPTSVSYRASPGNSQTGHVQGLPLGTRGGMLVEHLFPADGEYIFSINQSAGFGGGYISGLDSRQKLIMTIDGEKVFETGIGGPEDLKAADQRQAPAVAEILERFRNIKVHVKAGPRKIGIAFLARSFAESEDTLEPLGASDAPPRSPIVLGVDIVGPHGDTRLSETPSRRKIFTCRPATADEERPCAVQIVSRVARQAYRRPVTEADLVAPMRFYDAAREKGKDFERGIQQALMAILASPKFLYRVEAVPENATPGSIYRISDIELASRLSFFLWSRGPDEELLRVAAEGRLHEPHVLEEQVQRMLADPRSKSLVTGFAMQWLLVDEVDAIEPDPTLFPEFDGALREAFKKELELFVESVFSEDRSVVDLLTADYTFVNERLALHYGIPNVRGARFRRVKLPTSARYGLLGKGSFLMGMSYANRTSPVRRGAYVLEQIIGTPPAAPPPGVEALKENMSGSKPETVRERMLAHRTDPTCNSCHGVIDPLGFALENFDAIGAWRDKDRETATIIDATEIVRGRKLTGPDDLRNLIAERPAQFVQTVTEKLMTYALGRGIEYHDMPTIRAIVRESAKQNYRFSAIVAGIVRSQPFQMRMVPDAGVATATAQAAK